VKSSLTKPMIVVLLLCLMYYVYACWISYGQLSRDGFALWTVILFGSGFAGLEVSGLLLMPYSKDVKRTLGFLLGVNGAISAVGWIFLGGNTLFFFLFMVGLAQFFYFSCVSLGDTKEVNR